MDNTTTTSEVKAQESASFTPGPWEVGEVEPPFEIVHTIPIRTRGASCWSVARVPDGLDDEANARLISAAPDLYAACEEAALQLEYLADKFPATGSGAVVLARLHAAIAKARGAA